LKILESKLGHLVDKLEKELEDVEKTVVSKLNLIDQDRDGVITVEELQQALNVMKEKLPEENMKAIFKLIGSFM
jgi:Ca2+-binding EF-hand superfamily protein